ncbi:PP2C family protein-serine/threonine phosphatase, partial [Paraconexibacter sp.]|uniref:PP2C family protein-serine/threonine phosphatase n=1 Tax=Paraconexibacter sp. TaxID=2949640 RepID=UPI00356A4EB4
MSGDRRLRPRVAALAVVQAVLFGLGPAVDLPVVLTPATAVPVLLVALEAGPRVTAAFGAATVVLALVSGSIDGTFLEAQHVVRVTTVVGASVVALLAAAGRCRLEALVLENVRLMRDLAAAEAAQRDVAQSLQRSLRPPALPQIPGVALASFYRAVGDGADVGGDFYDAFPLTDGWLLVIGDVTGKGAAAASVTGMARGAIEAAALETGSAVGAIVR